ncbi:MAG: ABC transporter ATP-binding protein [Candidatus Xenobia bacterium]
MQSTSAERAAEPLLEIRQLKVRFGSVQVVNGVDLRVAPGEALGLVGESGSGKSVTALSVLRLLPRARLQGEIRFNGEDLLRAPEARMRELRGSDIGMIFQDPMTALNPVLTIGRQVGEVLQRHGRPADVTSLLARVGIPDPAARARAYPHHFSGGMRQRVVIGMGIACEPALVLADEPTTALDVTIQAQIMELLAKLRTARTAIVLITHNLGLVAQFCDRVAVMYAGQIVETAPTAQLFAHPRHPYTQGLLASLPRLDVETDRLVPIPGQPPDLRNPLPGCPFRPRCPKAIQVCGVEAPPERDGVRCHVA